MEILNKSKLNFIKLLFIKNVIIYLHYMSFIEHYSYIT